MIDFKQITVGEISGAIAAVCAIIVAWISRNQWVLEPLQKLKIFIMNKITLNEDNKSAINEVLLKITDLQNVVSPPGKPSTRQVIDDLLVQMNSMENRTKIVFQRMSNLIDITKTPMYETDRHGMCTEANQELCKLFGLSREHMLYNGWGEAIPNVKDRLDVMKTWLEAVESDMPWDAKFQIYNIVTGEYHNVHSRATAMRNDDGSVFGYYGIVYVIDDQKKY